MAAPLRHKMIGITSTLPVEVLYAAECVPLDLNNQFITHPDPSLLIKQAERNGLPRNVCTWIKGIYALLRARPELKTVIAVVQGDCTPMISMLEALADEEVQLIPFAYPYEKNRQVFRWELQKLMDTFGVGWDEVNETKKKLDRVRKMAHELDRRAWAQHSVGSKDLLHALVNCTDFKGDPRAFGLELEGLMARTEAPAKSPRLKLGLLGVPGVIQDLDAYLEAKGARVIYHEVARQFAMPEYGQELLQQYLEYTYPYALAGRVADIQREIERRQLDGLVHYVQAFCHHQIEDLVFRKQLNLPILTLEGERVAPLDNRMKTRVDAFLHLLEDRKRG